MTNNTSTYYIVAYYKDNIREGLRRNHYMKFDTLSDAEKEIRRGAFGFGIYEVKESKIDSSSFSYQKIEPKKEEPVVSKYYIISSLDQDVEKYLKENFYIKYETKEDAERVLGKGTPEWRSSWNILEVTEVDKTFSFVKVEPKKDEPVVVNSKDIPVKTESRYIIADKNNNVAEFISDLAKGLHIINKPNYRDCKVLRMVTHFYEISEEDITNAKKEAFEKEVAELKKKYNIN